MTQTAVAPTELQTGYVGQSMTRKEDRRLVQGEGTFVDDVKRHGMGYIHFVRSPYAHARIISVDVSAAEALNGVYGTLTPAEVEDLTDPFFQLSTPPANQIRDYCLAVNKVRHIGEPVAAVVARTREIARDAADLVEVVYEPLPVLIDARRAQDADAPVIHQETGSNIVWSGLFDWGDVDGALNAADHIVAISELHFHRFSSTPLECSGAVVEYEPAADEFTMVCNHQFPSIAVVGLAPALRVAPEKLRIVTQDIGGGFGNKIATLTGYLAAGCLLARKLRRPVQWTEWRTDQHTANSHGNERWFSEIEVAVQSDGTLLGFKAKALDDCGAFPRYEPLGCVIWSQVAAACYRWRNIRVDFTQVTTNKAPVGANRGYSRMQHLWLCERIIDVVAHQLNLDPVEVRKRNYVRADEMPYETPNGCVYDSGDYARCLDIALDLVDYPAVRERQRRAEGNLIGIGIGSTLDSGTNNFAQSQLMNPALQFSGNNEAAIAQLELSGTVTLALGTVPQGQGHETTAAQVAADILGVSPNQVHVRTGHDTRLGAHSGLSGTYASQFAVAGLGAVKGAVELLAERIREIAAALVGASASDMMLEQGLVKRIDTPDVSLPLAAISAVANLDNEALPDALRDVGLTCRYVYRPRFGPVDTDKKLGNLALTYSTQVHVCVIEIDPDTGVLEVVDYAAVDDCGVRINPQIVEGQVHGATAHGIGAALYETFVYDEDGQLLTANFYDYHPPHALDLPNIKTGSLESRSPFTPLGAKGMGEGGGAAIHAVCAAIQDAFRMSGVPAIVTESHNSSAHVWEMLTHPELSRSTVRTVSV